MSQRHMSTPVAEALAAFARHTCADSSAQIPCSFVLRLTLYYYCSVQHVPQNVDFCLRLPLPLSDKSHFLHLACLIHADVSLSCTVQWTDL